VLIRQGELGREFVVIVDGEASVERRRHRGHARPRHHFGELALLVDHPRSDGHRCHRPQAAGDRPARFQNLLDSSPHLTKNLLHSVARRLSEVDARTDD
jgi:CRP-like cAMP-binding protein